MVLLSRSVEFYSRVALKQNPFSSAKLILLFNWIGLFFLFKTSLLNWPIQLTLVFSLKKRGWFRWAFYCLFMKKLGWVRGAFHCLFMKKLGWVGGAFQEIRELHFVAYHITHFMPFMNSVSGFSLHFFHEHFTLYFSQKTT